MQYIFVKPKNSLVTEYYLSIIEEAIKVNNNCPISYSKKSGIQKDDIFLVTNIIDAIKIIVAHPKNKFVFWEQGAEPEESYMRNKSLVRKKILSFLEYIVLKKSDMIFFVSKEMEKYNEKHYKLNLNFKSYIMPCFNVEIINENFFKSNKYKENSFAYVGSLAKWQCFNETMELYSKIEHEIKNSKLYVYTSSLNEARIVIEKNNIRNYQIKFVSQDNLNKELSEIKFGFCLREESLVNRVATPTKISSYLASGVIPIFTKSITSFSLQFAEMKYVVELGNVRDYKTILEFLKKDIQSDDVYLEYNQLFTKYYNRDKYIKEISSLAIFQSQ